MSVAKISVLNLQRMIPMKRTALQRFAESALAICRQLKKKSALTKFDKISVLLISDRRMASLHRRFLQTRGTTDVITFQHGEIFISAETARKNAARFRTTLHRELSLYIVHGLLHLDGFDDATAAGAEEMKTLQEKILAAAME
ncbi:MAG: putative rRNA maturation factor [Verrucomicrobiota bacterium]|jgi:probable rRNA maturation factor